MKTISYILTVAAITAALTSGVCAEKITSDPNATPTQTPQPKLISDSRLDQKIEYDAGNQRLHDVIANLAKSSGVTIYCGRTTDDWRVRDIPMTIAARGIALRDLLQYIVYTTHTQLTSKKNDDGGVHYRIVADPNAQKAMIDDTTTRDDYQKAYARASLEMAPIFKDIPASKVKPFKGMEKIWPDYYAFMVQASRLFAAMDPAMKEAALAGQKITLTPRTAPANLRDTLLSGVRATDEYIVNRALEDARENESSYPRTLPALVSTENLEDSRVDIYSNGLDIHVNYQVKVTEGTSYLARGQATSSSGLALLVRDHYKGKANPVKDPDWPKSPQILPPNSDSKPLDWNDPAVPRTVTLALPEGDKPLKNDDAVIAMSKVTGLSIICADYMSCYRTDKDLRSDLCKEMAFPSALSRAMDDDYMFDSRTKSIVSCNHSWAVHQKNLLPESIIERLIAKANADGVDVDDMAMLADYSEAAVRAWTRRETLAGTEINADPFISPANKPIWAYYNSLSPSKKAQVKTPEGLPLAAPTNAAVLAFLRHLLPPKTDFPNQETEKSIAEQLLSPKVLPTLVMRLEKTEYRIGWLSDGSEDLSKVPACEKKHRSNLIIEGTDISKKITLAIGAGDRLPFYSPERQKALDEEKNKQNKNTTIGFGF